MKRILYTMPAVMICLFYGMLAILAGGFGGFQPRAWLMIILPVTSALLLLGGRWWGCIPGMLLGGLMISIGMYGTNQLVILFGVAVFAYYLVMGLLCWKDAQKNS